MIRRQLMIFLPVWLCLLLPWPIAAAQYNYIDISNPFLRKTPIAVPVFKAPPQDPTAMAAAKAASEILGYYLEFSGYFTLSDPGAFNTGQCR